MKKNLFSSIIILNFLSFTLNGTDDLKNIHIDPVTKAASSSLTLVDFTFKDLGEYSSVPKVSGNGRVITGFQKKIDDNTIGYVIQDDQYIPLGYPEQGDTVIISAEGINFDGSIVVGSIIFKRKEKEANSLGKIYPYAWVKGTDKYQFIQLSEEEGVAYAISGGGVIAGEIKNGFAHGFPALWRKNSDNKYETIKSKNQSKHYGAGCLGISEDSKVIVGPRFTSNWGSPTATAFKVNLEEGASSFTEQSLATSSYCMANCVSVDGKVIVGCYQYSYNLAFAPPREVVELPVYQACMWENDTRKALGVLSSSGISSPQSEALACNRDGSVIVGKALGAHDDCCKRIDAFVWTKKTGIRSLTQLLGEHGVIIPAGYKLTKATGIDATGKIVVGTAEVNGKIHAYKVTVPEVTAAPSWWYAPFNYLRSLFS